jgi:hypothetical protein
MSYNTITGNAYLSETAPTGSLSAYVASSDPIGWVICDGVVRTNNSDGKYNNLASLGIGTGGSGTSNYTPPNLKGSFLRGIGTASNTNYSGATFKSFQGQQLVNHGHPIGSHSHKTISNATTYYSVAVNVSGNNTVNDIDNTTGEVNCINSALLLNTASTGARNLTTGNSVASGVAIGSETRPYNYGVNWILKL